jgi:hypothetical protein
MQHEHTYRKEVEDTGNTMSDVVLVRLDNKDTPAW